MDRVFKSKVSLLYHFAILVMALGTVLVFIKGTSVLIMISMLLGTFLCIHILLTTWYKITDDGQLVAHCSIFPEKRMPISEITEVEVTVMPVSSYALSLDRLIIYRQEKPWLIISPVNKKDFVAQLRKINPEIKIKDPVI